MSDVSIYSNDLDTAMQQAMKLKELALEYEERLLHISHNRIAELESGTSGLSMFHTDDTQAIDRKVFKLREKTDCFVGYSKLIEKFVESVNSIEKTICAEFDEDAVNYGKNNYVNAGEIPILTNALADKIISKERLEEWTLGLAGGVTNWVSLMKADTKFILDMELENLFEDIKSVSGIIKNTLLSIENMGLKMKVDYLESLLKNTEVSAGTSTLEESLKDLSTEGKTAGSDGAGGGVGGSSSGGGSSDIGSSLDGSLGSDTQGGTEETETVTELISEDERSSIHSKSNGTKSVSKIDGKVHSIF